MTGPEVFQSPQFAQLSIQQRTFLKEMCSNGWDKLEAAKKAWNCKNENSANAQANRAMRHPVISQLIALIDPAKSRMTKDEALQLAAKHARTATEVADVVKCLQLIDKWEGWSAAPPPPDPAESGDIYKMAEAIERKQP